MTDRSGDLTAEQSGALARLRRTRRRVSRMVAPVTVVLVALFVASFVAPEPWAGVASSALGVVLVIELVWESITLYRACERVDRAFPDEAATREPVPADR